MSKMVGTTETTESKTATLTINATVAFVAAHLVVIILHETSHLVAVLTVGYTDVMYPFGVEFTPGPDRADAAITALTGPALSLVTDLLAMIVTIRQRSRGFFRLA